MMITEPPPGETSEVNHLRPMNDRQNPVSNTTAAIWGVLGVTGILVFPIVRLTPIAWEAIDAGLNPLQWLLLIASVVLMAWSEGYRGFQRRFSPRVAARAFYIYRNELPLVTKILAPFFCCGFFRAGRRARVGAWLGTIGIITHVWLVHHLSQPWRGILDAGVVVGLSWGTITLFSCVRQAFAGKGIDHSPDVP
jgi:hypothetical protein